MGKEALTMNEDTDSKDADITFFAEYNNEDKKCVLKFPHQFFLHSFRKYTLTII